MEIQQRDDIRSRILQGEKYYCDNGRFTRLRKRPLKMLSHYALTTLSMVRPFTVPVSTLWGDTMRVYLPDSGVLFLKGYHEANLANFLVNLLEAGDVFLDIGAHVGYYSMLASSLVGDDGSVVSIEPTPRTFGLLRENTKPKSNVTVHNVAALNEAKDVEFFDYGPRYGALNSLGTESRRIIPYRINAEPIRTRTVTIDELCGTSGVVPTVVKIDAEGSERLILQGMRRVLEEAHPMIAMEVAGSDVNQKWGRDSDESVHCLRDQGYECLHIAPNGRLAAFEPRGCRGVDVLLFVHSRDTGRIEGLLDPAATLPTYLAEPTSRGGDSKKSVGSGSSAPFRRERSRSTHTRNAN